MNVNDVIDKYEINFGSNMSFFLHDLLTVARANRSYLFSVSQALMNRDGKKI